MTAGPLKGIKIVEIAGLGPGPFAAMLLADLGADVIRVERKEGMAAMKHIGIDTTKDVLNRSRSAVALDLKHSAGIAAVLEFVSQADALIEGFRPGVMERLGLGPDICRARNPRLVYGRMTGWGQTGPLANTAGHDIDYIARSGMLHTFARSGEKPLPPGNLVGDMGGGGLMLAFGIVCAVLEARSSGKGQVVDTAMFEGAATLGVAYFGLQAMGIYDWNKPGENLSDSGTHFYEVYETSDRKHIAIGAIEPQFYAALLKGLGLDAASLPKQMESKSWPAMKGKFTEIFRGKSRAEWERIFEGSDACFAPVLTPDEAASQPHAVARGSHVRLGGVLQPAPAPSFSRTPGEIGWPPAKPGEGSDGALLRWGFSAERIASLRTAGALY
jgi:alpha-methylacyl-CoA racemase